MQLADYQSRIAASLAPQPAPLGQSGQAAAVLMPILTYEDSPAVMLTKRAAHLAKHSGEVAFPGGASEAQDTSLEYTALREAEEEVGLPARAVEVAGFLPSIRTGTGYAVQPVVGYVRSAFAPKPNPQEVAEVFFAPLALLMNENNYTRQSGVWAGKRRHYYVLDYNGYRIWGMTAQILRGLAQTAFMA